MRGNQSLTWYSPLAIREGRLEIHISLTSDRVRTVIRTYFVLSIRATPYGAFTMTFLIRAILPQPCNFSHP